MHDMCVCVCRNKFTFDRRPENMHKRKLKRQRQLMICVWCAATAAADVAALPWWLEKIVRVIFSEMISFGKMTWTCIFHNTPSKQIVQWGNNNNKS